MKNLMDFSIGSLIFWILGYTLMYGEDVGGFLGKISLFYGSNEINGVPDKASLMFQTVFAATAATIVSGAVAERTKFSAYIVFSIAITAIIYPISGHWVWGGGWLSTLSTPFHDFAGSTVVHSVGAWVGLMGAIVIGPRIGKYTSDGKAKGNPRFKPGLWCPGRFHSLVRMVRFQPRIPTGSCRKRKCLSHFPYIYHHQPGCSSRCCYCHDHHLE